MTWRKYFTPANITNTNLSVISGGNNGSNPGPSRTNYSSYLPDVYSGSPNRIDRYQQYEVMDSDPEINAALDILAEFCTQKLKDNKSPFAVKWRHKATNSEVRILAEYLQQWNKLQQFDTRIFRIVRNTFKYGDSFFIRDPETQKWHWVDPSKVVKIIVNESDGKRPEQYVIKDLAPNFEDLVVTQITPNINPRQTGGGITSSPGYFGATGMQRGTSGPYPSASSGSRFGLSETEYAIDAEHVVHLSLSEGLDNNYPFGNSLLENIFKVYKQKELLEDAILIYRIQRAPERRVFHIDVGNMPSHMAMAFVERIKNEIHQRRIPSQSGGGMNVVDSAYNPLCLSLDTMIPLLDGRTLSLNEIIQEFEQGKENWAYSCDPITGEIVPGVIDWAGVTRKNAEVIELTLDNGEKLICTPDHKIPVFNKGFIEAKDLTSDDELIAFVIKNNRVWDHKLKNWVDLNIEEALNQLNENYKCKISNINQTTSRDVGTITIDGQEKWHSYHTFATSCGIFVKNSINEDYFFPKTCLSLHEKIKLLDDRDLELVDIIQEFEQGKENFVYTVNQITHEIEPGKIVWAGITRKNTQLVEVLLDNNQKIKVTPDHRFILRDGSEKEAQYLLTGDSLMPLYLHNGSTGKHQGADKYLRYTCNVTGKKKWVHTMVCPKSISGKETEIHHIDCNSRNNNPTNLIEMSTSEHRKLHKSLGTYHMTLAWSDEEKRKKIVDGIRKYHANATAEDKEMFRKRGRKNGANTWLKEENKEKILAALNRNHIEVSKRKTIKFSEEMCHRFVELYDLGYDSLSKIIKTLRSDEIFQQKFKEANQGLLRDKNKPSNIMPTYGTVNKIVQTIGYDNWGNFKESYKKNHKVVSVTWLDITEDTGDITVESINNNHNFALTAGVFIHNSEGRGSDVTTLPGGCFAMDTRVSLLDGRELSISEIAEEMKTGQELWTYSCNPLTGEIVPGLISWAGVTQASAKVMKITLDNGKSFICTPEHKLVTRNEGFKRADEMVVGDSLMPLYRQRKILYNNADYEQTFDNLKKKWINTHRIVAEYLKDKKVLIEIYDQELGIKNHHVVHHKNFNRHDNNPNNLCFMNQKDHFKYHSDNSGKKMIMLKETNISEYNRICQLRSEATQKFWNSLSIEEKQLIGLKIKESIKKLSKEEKEKRDQRCRIAFKKGNQVFNEMMNSDPKFYNEVVSKRMKYWTEENRKIRSENTRKHNYKNWSGDKGQIRREKHIKLQSIEYTHDMLLAVIELIKGKSSHEANANSVVIALNNNQKLLVKLTELNQNKKVRNWNVERGFTENGVKTMVKQFGYKNWHDFRVKESIHNHKITKIEYLDDPIEVGTLTIDQDEIYHDYHTFALSAGVMVKNSNLGEIDDLRFFTNKLFRGLRIPSSYLPTGAEDSQTAFNDGRVGTAYIQELRFNKYCERLQTLITEVFDVEFKMYMYTRGINIDSNLFELQFNPPMNFASSRQATIDAERINTFNTIQAIPFMSNRFALKRFLGLTDEELAENERLWAEENGQGQPTYTDAAGELRSAGLSAAGIEGDLGMAGDLSAPEDLAAEGELGAEMGMSPAPAVAPATMGMSPAM